MLGLGADGLVCPLRSLGLPDTADASVSIMLYTEEPAPAVEVYWSNKKKVHSARGAWAALLGDRACSSSIITLSRARF